MSSKGQIVIPQKIREQMNMDEGSIIVIEKVEDALMMKKIDESLVSQIKRSLEDVKHGRIKKWKG